MTDTNDNQISLTVDSIGTQQALAKSETSTQLAERRIRTVGVGIKPPYNPDRLASFLELNETHATAVRKKARYEVGFGFDIVPHDDVDAEDASEDERDEVTDFWRGRDTRWLTGPSTSTGPTTPEEVLELARQDYHSIGWCCLEILANNAGEPVGLAHVPANTVRVRKPRAGDDDDRVVDHEAPDEYEARGYVQKRAGRRRFFGVAGDRYRGQGEDDDREPLFVDKETGDVAVGSAKELDNDPANELIFVRNPSPLEQDYGIPDWVSAIRTIAADEAAKDYNREFFDNDTIPRLVIKVTGGELSEASREDLRQMLHGLREESHRAVTLEVEKFQNQLENDDVEIELEPLGQGISEEMDFREFRQKNEHEIAKVHEVPPILIGVTETSNRSNSQEQVHDFAVNTVAPEQHKFAQRLYQLIHQTALGVTDWTIEFELRGADQPKEEAEVARRKIQAVNGAIPVDRALEMIGEDPLDEGHPIDGDTLVAEVGQSGPPGGGGGPPGGGQPPPEDADVDAHLPPAENKIGERDWADVEGDLATKDPIEQVQFDSSNLDEGLYDFGEQELFLSFQRDEGQSSLYAYVDVPTSEWAGLVNASSHGSYHYEEIRLEYPYVEVTNFHDRLPEGEMPDDPPDDVPLSAAQGGRDFSERRKTPSGVPDDAHHISDESECDGTVHEGPRGGLYCEPGGGEDGDGVSVPESASEAATLQEQIESGEVVEDSTLFWKGRDAQPEMWSDDFTPAAELEPGDVVRSDHLSYGDEYVGEVVETTPEADPPTVTLDTDSRGQVTVEEDGNRYHFKPDEEAISETSTPTQLFEEEVASMSDSQRSASVGYVVQESRPSNTTGPQYAMLLDSLSQDELQDAVVDWSTQSTTVADTHDNNSLRDLSEMDAPAPDDEPPSGLGTDASRMGYLFSRMDADSMTTAVDEAYDELTDRGEDALAAEVVTSAAAYGQSADGRREVYEEYGDEIEFDEYAGPAVEMQFTDDVKEFRDIALDGWVRSETSAESHHLTLATQTVGPNSEANTAAYTTDVGLFDDNSAGVPHAPIEPTEEFESNVEQLREQAAEYYTENETPTLHRGVSAETTTHGTLESWSESESVARSFDGHSVLEAEVEPDDILVSQDMLGDDWPEPENIERSEDEVVLFGGAFAEA